MSRKKIDQIETQALWINPNATASCGVTYIWNDPSDDYAFKIGRANQLGENVRFTIDCNGCISGTFCGGPGSGIWSVVETPGDDDIYVKEDIGVGTDTPYKEEFYTYISTGGDEGSGWSMQVEAEEKWRFTGKIDDLTLAIADPDNTGSVTDMMVIQKEDFTFSVVDSSDTTDDNPVADMRDLARFDKTGLYISAKGTTEQPGQTSGVADLKLNLNMGPGVQDDGQGTAQDATNENQVEGETGTGTAACDENTEEENLEIMESASLDLDLDQGGVSTSTLSPGSPLGIYTRMRVTNRGDVGIGVMFPEANLHVSGNTIFGSQGITVKATASIGNIQTGVPMDGTQEFSLTASNGTTIYNFTATGSNPGANQFSVSGSASRIGRNIAKIINASASAEFSARSYYPPRHPGVRVVVTSKEYLNGNSSILSASLSGSKAGFFTPLAGVQFGGAHVANSPQSHIMSGSAFVTKTLSASLLVGDGSGITNITASEIAAAGSDFEIQYNLNDDLAASANLTFDTSTLRVTGTVEVNGNVGIGNTDPDTGLYQAKLIVSSSDSTPVFNVHSTHEDSACTMTVGGNITLDSLSGSMLFSQLGGFGDIGLHTFNEFEVEAAIGTILNGPAQVGRFTDGATGILPGTSDFTVYTTASAGMDSSKIGLFVDASENKVRVGSAGHSGSLDVVGSITASGGILITSGGIDLAGLTWDEANSILDISGSGQHIQIDCGDHILSNAGGIEFLDNSGGGNTKTGRIVGSGENMSFIAEDGILFKNETFGTYVAMSDNNSSNVPRFVFEGVGSGGGYQLQKFGARGGPNATLSGTLSALGVTGMGTGTIGAFPDDGGGAVGETCLVFYTCNDDTPAQSGNEVMRLDHSGNLDAPVMQQYCSVTRTVESTDMDAGDTFSPFFVGTGRGVPGGTTVENASQGIVYSGGTLGDGKFTILHTGTYEIVVVVMMIKSIDGVLDKFQILNNGSAIWEGNVHVENSSDPLERTMAGIFDLTAGDEIDIALQTPTIGGGTLIAEVGCTLNIKRIR